MGILSAIGGRRVYLDANIFIYWLENHANYLVPLTDLFQALDNGLIQAVTSNGCDAILTNDHRLHQLSPLKVVFLTDFVAAR